MANNKQFVVIGLDGFGYWVAETLAKEGVEVLAIDKKQERVQQIADKVLRAVRIDATDLKALKAVGVNAVDNAIFSIDTLEDSVLVAINLKDLGIANITAKSSTNVQKRILEKLGIGRIIEPEREMAIRFANQVMAPHIFDYLLVSDRYSIIELRAPSTFWNRTLRDINVRANYGVNVIGIKKIKWINDEKEEELIIAPGADGFVEEGDVLMIIGDNSKLEKIRGLT